MAAGQPFLHTDIDQWLYAVLSADELMQEYAPGGFWSNDPDQVSNGPWSEGTTYNVLDIANGIDGFPYRSKVANNIGNEPSVSPADWALCFPCVRWWVQSPGVDTNRQDGQAGRAMSNPYVVVTMLDRQRGGSIDMLNGTIGTFALGTQRLATLLHARNQIFTLADGRTSEFTAYVKSGYTQIEPASGGYDVMAGHRYALHIQ